MEALPTVFWVLAIICVIAFVAMSYYVNGNAGRHTIRDRDGNEKLHYPHRRWVAAAALVFALLGVGSAGFVVVPAGYVGVVRFFGQVQGQVLYPGATWLVPFVNQVEEVDTRVQPHNFQQLTAATAENLQVTVTGTMNYHLDAAFAGDLIQRVGPDFAAKIIDPAFSDYIKQVVPAYSADSGSPSSILNKRDEIRQLTKTQLGINLERYHIIVDDIYIVDIGYPDAFNQAIVEKQVAQQQVQTEQQVLLQKQIQAQQAVAVAEGQAEANRTISESLSDQILLYQYISKISPNVRVMLIPGNQSFLLDLKALLDEQQAPGQ
ncbi:MAG: prohibitin family protein [Candidatus Limnocylindrales bacterium]